MTRFADAGVRRFGIVADMRAALPSRRRLAGTGHAKACHERTAARGCRERPDVSCRYCHWILNASCPCREMLAAEGRPNRAVVAALVALNCVT